MNPQKIRERIEEAMPPGSVKTEHNEKGHYYRIVKLDKVYPSVTGKLQILKDPSIANWKMNRALDYVNMHYQHFTPNNIVEHLEKAALLPQEIFEGAGSIGTLIHDYREKYFQQWIDTGKKPGLAVDIIPADEQDVRSISAMRGLDKFISDWNYIPVTCEMFVWSEKFEVAGTLDDIGIVQPTPRHKPKLMLLDVKTSNQFKDYFFFQVGMYLYMFMERMGIFDKDKKNTDLQPDQVIILKLSKDNGTYSIEEMSDVRRLIAYSKAVLKVNEGIKFIRNMRKDNQKNVVKI